MTSVQGQGEGAHSLLYKEEEARVLSSTESQSNSEQETVMIDFIAGMTDRYARMF